MYFLAIVRFYTSVVGLLRNDILNLINLDLLQFQIFYAVQVHYFSDEGTEATGNVKWVIVGHSREKNEKVFAFCNNKLTTSYISFEIL